MSDDNNQKSRGPRKGGGAGGKGGGFRGGDGKGRGPAGGRSSGGERKPFRGRSEDDRPRRSSADGAERPARRFDKPTGQRDGAPRPPREGGERPFRARAEGERATFRARSGEDRPRRASTEGGERPARRFDKPADQREGAPRSRNFGDRDGGKRFDKPKFDRPARSRTGDDRPRRPRRDEAELQAAPRILPSEKAPERIAKVMARAGVASRRESEAMIEEGRVSVNGAVIESPALDVGPNDIILVDGEPLPERERTRMWLYHKPRGLVTTNHDPEGRPTVFEALPEDLPRVLTIGRLDINTEGLLLLTNDGGLARVLELPETGWLRRYRVRAFGSVTQDRLDTLSNGVTIEGVAYGPVIARFEREQGSNTWLTVDLREGKNREVKTVLEHLGLAVNRLIRVSFGPFQLGDLDEGEVDEIRSRVLRDQLGEELMAKAGTDFEAPRRDEVPAPHRRAPSGDDRPRRRDGARPGHGEDSARTPSRDERRSEKPWKRTVWRDAEAEPQRERKAPPRRGADPKLERQTREEGGEVRRKRDTPIADPKGRRVLVERVSAPAREEAPGRKPRAERSGPVQRVKRSERGAAEHGLGDRPARRPREETAGRDRGDERPWQERAPRGERPARTPREGAERPRGRSFGDRPPGRSAGGKPAGGRPFGGKPGGGKSGGGKPGGRGPRPGGGKRD
ncbi:pseudouridine synthase [Bosea sp. BK604]|uniref:pseudouridine synthase n=1 Tax=Bosea sp. BK604 TaxID=2512180 RepID=UPI00104DCAD1|nr:pseudouridine synthase [Bosea sp. BK604]TCR61472.1 23S rRNA pseudouridine2605 synthase [Bosea sp. BK604]